MPASLDELKHLLKPVLKPLRFFDDSVNNFYFANEGNRQVWLEQAREGMYDTHQPFISKACEKTTGNCHYFLTDAFGDDPGIYYLLPKLSNFFSISISHLYDIFFFTIILISFLLSLVGFFLLYKQKKSRIIIAILLCIISFYCVYIMDTFIFPCLTLSSIPLLIYFIKKFSRKKKLIPLVIIFILTGLFAGFCNWIRGFSGIFLVVFVVLFIIQMPAKNFKVAHKVLLIVILIATFYTPSLYQKMLINNRNSWLSENKINIRVGNNYVTGHVFWHMLYVGLGYIPNPYNITWSDWQAFANAMKINPSINPRPSYEFLPIEYELTIKNEYLRILKKDPWFVLKTYFLKAMAVFIYAIKFMLPGLILLLFKRKKMEINFLPFFFIAIFISAQGVLTWPFPIYMAGLAFMMILISCFIAGETFKVAIKEF